MVDRRIPRVGVYFWIAAVSVVFALLVSYTSFATQIDNDVYDFLFRLTPARASMVKSAVLAIDETSLAESGGMRRLRHALAEGLTVLAEHKPAVLAVDLTLADRGEPGEDEALAAALAKFDKVVLACEMMPDGTRWQEPVSPLAGTGTAIGHVSALPDAYDAINREIPLERVAGGIRRWALSVEAFRLFRNVAEIESSPSDVMIGETQVVSRWEQGRPMRIRFRASDSIPRVSLADLRRNPERGKELAGRVVFAGVTAQSAARDRLLTPLSYSLPLAGVEIHAQAFETLDTGDFLDSAPMLWPVLLATGFAFAIATAFALLVGWPAYSLGIALLLAAHLVPWLMFRQGLILPPTGPITSAWLAMIGCFSWQHFVVRRQLAKSESDRARYQQAIRFVTHEMRTPLTAIQGSSELVTRYNLPEEKRKQIGQMINSESKRLAQMITTFLNVEKLSAGQMDLKRVSFPLTGLLDTCLERARPLAEKKSIEMVNGTTESMDVEGDPELLEYAVYNLITNAIKYSPEQTKITLAAQRKGGEVRLAVRDQGYGMEEHELKRLFTRFFRASSAQRSGEIGTGLGLSIVDQIVTEHGGRMEVSSAPGQGSCFTVVLPAQARF